MTKKEQRIFIAEACGWKINQYGAGAYGGSYIWIAPNGSFASEVHIPNYLEDLNACHEMEKVLTWEQQGQYAVELGKLTTSYLPAIYAAWMDFTLTHASAAQRCEAFIKTLNLRKE